MAPSSTAEILAGLAEIIEVESGVPAGDVRLSASFADDLDIDSLSVMTIVVAAELRFGVQFPDEELRQLRTVGDVVGRVEQEQAAPADTQGSSPAR